MGDLVKGMVEPLAKRWTASMSGPLLLLWLSGALIHLHQRGGPGHACVKPGYLARAGCQIAKQGAPGAVLLTAALAAAVLLSGVALSAVASPVLEMLAGRWGTSAPVVAYARHRTARHARRRAVLDARSRAAAAPAHYSPQAQVTWQAQSAWRRDRALRSWSHYPRRAADLRPTSVGNALVGVCEQIRRDYGFELPVCWGPFVECLDTAARDRLMASATRVLGRTQALICAVAAAAWALLLPGLVAKALWIALCAACAWGANRALRSGTEAYCAHVCDAFAVHRIRLYRATGIEPPATTTDEPRSGKVLTDALAMRLAPGESRPFRWPETP
ncbi:hypothetical protein IPZ70_01640 [Streptomyces polychromogenes]|nr:hypothetical protein [Streptomyces polychromogenes]